MTRIRWPSPVERDRPLPRRPYRDGALVYGGMTVVIVAFSAVTGGSVVRALLVAVAFFVVAMTWTWWRTRSRRRAGAPRP